MNGNTLIDYILHLADSNLILSQRNSAWCGHGPVLEQDIAITNISLDLLGQARNFYQYAAQLMNEVENAGVTEDSLAYLRTEREFKNLLLAEQANGHWGQTILRQFFYSQFQFLLYEQLQYSSDTQIAAIAAKAIKETVYHLRWSSEWVVRLGDGTEESRTKMLEALEALWPYTGELFIPAVYEQQAAGEGYGTATTALRESWTEKVYTVLEEATLLSPDNSNILSTTYMHTGGKMGVHTEQLGYILTDLQYMQRAYPDSQW